MISACYHSLTQNSGAYPNFIMCKNSTEFYDVLFDISLHLAKHSSNFNVLFLTFIFVTVYTAIFIKATFCFSRLIRFHVDYIGITG
jgi:hypothetical protein